MTSILSGNRLPALISDDDSDSSTDIDDEDIGPSRVTNDLPPLVTDSDSSGQLSLVFLNDLPKGVLSNRPCPCMCVCLSARLLISFF